MKSKPKFMAGFNAAVRHYKDNYPLEGRREALEGKGDDHLHGYAWGVLEYQAGRVTGPVEAANRIDATWDLYERGAPSPAFQRA